MSVLKTVFMFSGQGSHYFQMGRELFDTHHVFRHWMTRLDRLAQEMAGGPIIDAIYSAGKDEIFDRTLLTHPAIFMIEYSLAQCLLGEGIAPDLTLGASLGSFAAATLAGCMSVEDALAAVIQQAITFEDTCERGGMIAVLADRALYSNSTLAATSELAADNFATHFAVAARQAHLHAIESELRTREIMHQRLAVSFAFHSRWIDQAQAPFTTFMRSIPCVKGTLTLPLVCCDQAAVLSELPPDFFWRAVRNQIRLRETIAQLESQGTYRYIDVGPSGTMATFVKYALPPASASTAHAILTPFGQDRKHLAALLQAR
ncbi:MmpIII [Caballeronia udeis]|uniref:MmpIII n=1 Tax=Caballeronia udeis TaxID=1232866 RepID=A0A158GL60_9BURK|nr:acyltransferase domain-containing protein [Caballeronia udeis]SAL32844.1 MmpIII [Caballeronia udeis]